MLTCLNSLLCEGNNTANAQASIKAQFGKISIISIVIIDDEKKEATRTSRKYSKFVPIKKDVISLSTTQCDSSVTTVKKKSRAAFSFQPHPPI